MLTFNSIDVETANADRETKILIRRNAFSNGAIRQNRTATNVP